MDKDLCPKFADSRVTFDGPVQHRFCERRLIGFVMTVPTVTHEIDHEISLEASPVRQREQRRFDAGLGFVRIDVNDGNLEALGQITGIE